MKVLIVTYYCTNNYGSFLQAWSLGEFFKKNGCEVYYWASKDLESKNIVNPKNIYKTGRDKILKSCLQSFQLDYECKTKYDLVVVGSDVIWSSTKIKQFWGVGFKSKSTISYAASMWGMCDSESVPLKIRKIVEKKRLLSQLGHLKKFKAISVRDKRTEEAIKKIVHNKPKVFKVLDPTFLIDNIAYKRIIKDDYVLVYSYSLIGEEINPVFEYARNNNYKICVIGHEAKYADYNPIVDPFELHSLFKFSKAVFTTTFHGTALSIIINCQFVTFNSKKSKQLLEDLNLNSRFVDPEDAIETLNTAINYSEINKIISKKRKESIDFLKSFIPNEK